MCISLPKISKCFEILDRYINKVITSSKHSDKTNHVSDNHTETYLPKPFQKVKISMHALLYYCFLFMQALESYINNGGKEHEGEILEIIDSLGGRFSISALTFKDELLKLAETKFIQGPAFITNIVKTVFNESGLDINGDVINAKFSSLKPTVTSVLNLFVFDEIESKEQHLAAEYLKRFVKSLSNEKVSKFLQLLTGADIIVVEKISVHFINVTGFRKPMFRTCAPVLDLPINYRDYTDFKHEFSSIMSCNNDFGMP